MSLILDALNKADREREYRDAVPDLKTVHATPRQARNYRAVWLIGGVVTALVLAIALLLVIWLRAPAPAPQDNVPAPTRESAPAKADPAPAEPVALPQVATVPLENSGAPVLELSEALPPAIMPVDQEVQALYQTQQDTQVMQVIEPAIQPAAPQEAGSQTRRSRSSVDEELARVLWEESRRDSQRPLPTAFPAEVPTPVPAEVKAVTASAEAKPLPADLPAEETLAGYQSIPFLHELPLTIQDSVPTLMYAKHDYDKGFVVINKEELQMGSAAKGGVLLERILADGVLLSLNGTQFKLSSLSSWVNY